MNRTKSSTLSILCALAVGVALIFALPAVAEEAAAETAADDPAATFHGLGLMISQQLAPLGATDAELEQVIRGIREGLKGEAEINPREIMPKVQKLAADRAKKAGEAERVAANAFLAEKAELAKTKGGVVTDSGLIYTELAAGTGDNPKPTDRVKVHYHGTLRTGEVFDSSRERGQPATFGLNQVIKCWTEGVAMMKPGGKAELVCPSDIAYGDRPAGKIPPGAALVFEVELIEVVTAEAN
ncbi:MAG: FKBP-type peptidyl-prolyl cis-trans isomerase [Acidobacteriota bacterium]